MIESTTENFDYVLEQSEKIIYHLLHKLGIRDPEQEFYQEGVVTLWKAMLTYDPTRGKFSTYAYFVIEKALITMINTRNHQSEKNERILAYTSPDQLLTAQDTGFDPYLYEQISSVLTSNQLKWFTSFVLHDLSIKEIAEKEHVTVDAVKNWARLAKPKIRKILIETEIV